MLELGFNQTTYGQVILAACFINDLGTVLALGLIFLPFTKKTLFLPTISLVSLLIFAFPDAPVLRTSRGRASELEAKYLLFRLFGPGSIADWSGNEAVLRLYHRHGACRLRRQDHFLIRRLHSLPPELCCGQSRRLVLGCS
jgi:glutathione-regulated potassium-efflux system ancillary protein KefC